MGWGMYKCEKRHEENESVSSGLCVNGGGEIGRKPCVRGGLLGLGGSRKKSRWIRRIEKKRGRFPTSLIDASVQIDNNVDGRDKDLGRDQDDHLSTALAFRIIIIIITTTTFPQNGVRETHQSTPNTRHGYATTDPSARPTNPQ